MNIQSYAYAATWAVNTIYFLALLPQIRLNHRLRSTTGLSDSMLLMYLGGYIVETYYVHLLPLPLSYKLLIPGGLLAVMVLIAQRLWYALGEVPPLFVSSLYALGILFVALSGASMYAPLLVGRACGWSATFLFGIYQIPQVIRVYKTKSVRGLSLFFILLLGLGTTLEFFSGLVLGLPMPSLVSGFRGMIVYSFFCIMFFLYWDN